jgi:hypothetical protein
MGGSFRMRVVQAIPGQPLRTLNIKSFFFYESLTLAWLTISF